MKYPNLVLLILDTLVGIPVRRDFRSFLLHFSRKQSAYKIIRPIVQISFLLSQLVNFQDRDNYAFATLRANFTKNKAFFLFN